MNPLSLAIALSIFSLPQLSHAAGTINLPAGAYCATTQIGGVSNGVTPGACTFIPTQPPGSCNGPAGMTRLVNSPISYGVYPYPIRNADVREYDNIWGHFNATDAMSAWPGHAGAGPMINQFERTSFLAAHFRTGSVVPARVYFVYSESLPGPNVDIEVSRTCGDFSALLNGCHVVNAGKGGNVLTLSNGDPTAYHCGLLPNTDYYFNMKMTDPNSTTYCAPGAACAIELSISY